MSARKRNRSSDDLSAAWSPEALAEVPEPDRERYTGFVKNLRPAAFSSVLAGSITAGTVEAMRFELVNEKHEPLAVLGTTEEDHPGLAIFGSGSDHPRAELLLESAGPALRLNNAKGHQRVLIRHSDKHGPEVVLYDPKGKPRLLMMIDRDHAQIVVIKPSSRMRHGVAFTKVGHLGGPAAWKRATAALRSGKRAVFDRAAQDCGFLSTDLDDMWRELRRERGGKPRRKASRPARTDAGPRKGEPA